MKLQFRSACFLIWLALALAPGAWAGGDAIGEPDDHNPDEGPPFWGFVKDESGRPVRDAKVSASYKSSLTLVTRTNATGVYKVRGFNKEINISDVTITCAKEGYKQIRTFRRPPVRGKPVKSVETECRLQRVKS